MEMRRDAAKDLSTIYMGGGTPGILSADGIAKVLDTAKDVFSIRPAAEITVETNPGTVSVHKMEMLRGGGVNRISLGVQSLHDHELSALGRCHTSNDALIAVHDAREAGFDNISTDLMYGIPGQTAQSWDNTLFRALEMDPEHISAYELTPEKSTPLYKGIEQGSITLPDEEVVTGMYYRCIDILKEHGYVHYEISNFAKPGYECIHNLNYWNRGEYLGVGTGAHSFLNARRSGNIMDVTKYIESIVKEEIPVSENLDVNGVEAIKEFIFLGMRKIEGLDIRRVPEGEKILKSKAVEELSFHGLAEIDGNFLRLTEKGLVLSNEVFIKIFQMFD
jgi:oxygen-independent coproporphyrinogen-3 oxidase